MKFMAYPDVKRKLETLPSGSFIGIDHGQKFIGLSICDPARTVAVPLGVYAYSGLDGFVQELCKHIKGRAVVGLVIGLPLNMDGVEGKRCQAVRDFAHALKKQNFTAYLQDGLKEGISEGGVAPAFITLWDERLSTAAIRDGYAEDVPPKDGTPPIKYKRNKNASELDNRSDAHSATFILQGFLEYLR